MTTDVVPQGAAGAEVAVIPDSVAQLATMYPALDPASDVAELVRLATGEEGVAVRRKDMVEIKVPAAGTTAFTIPDDTEEDGTRAVKKIRGVIVDWYKTRGYWPDPDPSGEPPACASRDGKTPIADGLFGPLGTNGPRYNPGGTCETCPMSKFGSARDPKRPGKRGRGQACNEMMSVVVLMPGEMLPVILRAPATSLDSMRKFMVSTALNRKMPFWGIECDFTLVLDTNKSGQEYNKVNPKFVSVLDTPQLALVTQYRNEFVLPLTQPWKTNPESMELANEDSGDIDEDMYSIGGREVAEDAEVVDEAPAGRGRRQ
jgi:hypothetical protein